MVNEIVQIITILTTVHAEKQWCSLLWIIFLKRNKGKRKKNSLIFYLLLGSILLNSLKAYGMPGLSAETYGVE